MQFHELAALLKEYAPQKIVKHEGHLLRARLDLEQGLIQSDAVYVTDDETLLSALFAASTTVITHQAPKGDLCANVLILPETASLSAVYSTVTCASEDETRLSDYTRRLFAILTSGGSLQSIVDEGLKILGNPIAVFDAGFKIIAANWDAVEHDPLSQRLAENRYLSPEDMKSINFDHIHARAMQSETPVLVKNPRYSGQRIIARLNIGPKNIGHLAVVDQRRPFSDLDFRTVSILSDVIVQQLQHDEFVRNSSGFHYEYLIADLLDGKVAIDKELQERMAYVDMHFEELIYVTVAELARSEQYLNISFVRNKFEQLLPGSRAMLYNGQLLLITTRRKKHPITPEETAQFRAYCKENGLFCGRSNPFSTLSELPAFYRQALRALELGVDHEGLTPSLFIYEDYAIEHLAFQFRQFEQPEVFCHPAVRTLLKYDREKESELAKTLYCFIRHERNSFSASEELHIHRNTLVYRMKKIEKLTQINLEDVKTRQYLLWSLHVCNNKE